jgi:predicted nucleotidyltransferase
MIELSDLSAVAHHAQDLCNPVFVGGAVVGLLLTDLWALSMSRPTDDIDVVAPISSYAQFQALEERLRALGWTNDPSVICRWRTPDGIVVDVRPQDSSVLGFANRWYPRVVETATTYRLPTGEMIRLVHSVAFVATKFEAFRERGNGDLYSRDLEDLVVVMEGRSTFEAELSDAPDDLRRFVMSEVRTLLTLASFEDALPGIIGFEADAPERARLLLTRLRAMASG